MGEHGDSPDQLAIYYSSIAILVSWRNMGNMLENDDQAADGMG